MEISIKENKQNRDKFLGELIARGDRDEIVNTALSLVDGIAEIETQYDRANARTCAAILWWSINEIEVAKLHIDRAINELTKPNMKRDKLTFLVKPFLNIDTPFEMVKDVFVEGGC